MSINPIAQTDAIEVATPSAPKDVTQTQPVAQKSTPATPPPAPIDTVKISSAAQTATETAVQTTREALSGDHQALRLLSKEAAAEETKESQLVKSQEA